jgi:hypothetical protein
MRLVLLNGQIPEPLLINSIRHPESYTFVEAAPFR